jgi:hypothetical protein
MGTGINEGCAMMTWDSSKGYKISSIDYLTKVRVSLSMYLARGKSMTRGDLQKSIFHHTYSIQLQEWLNSGIQEVEEEEGEVEGEGEEEEVEEVE